MERDKLKMEGAAVPPLAVVKGGQLSERTLGGWLEYWAEKTPDKEYIVYSDRDLRFTWSKFNERVSRNWSISARTPTCTRSASPTVRGSATMWT